MRKNCAEQLDACRKDENCLGVSRCVFEKNCLVWNGNPAEPGDAGAMSPDNRNPACFNECADPGFAYRPSSDGPDGGLLASPIDSLLVCQFAGAYAACNLGDLSCTGRYGWDPAPKPTARVTVFVHTGTFPELFGVAMPQVTVRACQLNQSVNCPVLSGYDLLKVTGRMGDTTFTLPTDDTGAYWYFEVTPGWPRGPKKFLFHTGRRLREDTVLSLATMEALYFGVKDPVDGGIPWNPNQGAIQTFDRGCELNLVGGLEVWLDGADARALYSGSGHLFETAPSPGSFGARIFGVEPGFHILTTRKGGKKVAEELVRVEADAVTVMNWLEPRRTPGSNE
jgi:hypothetical protein